MSPSLFRSSALGAVLSAVAVSIVPAVASADTRAASTAAPASTTAAPGTTAAPSAATTGASSATASPTATAAAARKVGSKPLRVGAHGARVKALQTLLSSAGFRTATDGQYGRTTAAVVRKFQRAANLRTSGVADAKTLTALKNATNGSAGPNTSGGFDVRSTGGGSQHLGDRIPLKKGMSGHDVKVLQDYLERAGFDTSVDGDFGTGTVKSVKQFETDQQLPADGVVDASDIDLLRSLIDGEASQASGSTTPTPAATTPGSRATVGDDGLAVAPADAPDVVKQIIAAGNEIAKTPYHYGGGHGKWQDSGYDCSGSVSYALHGAGLLDEPLVSGDFSNWGDKGAGQWVTIYANSGHVYIIVAGLRFDTSGRSAAGTRWQTASRTASGYTVTHPTGL